MSRRERKRERKVKNKIYEGKKKNGGSVLGRERTMKNCKGKRSKGKKK